MENIFSYRISERLSNILDEESKALNYKNTSEYLLDILNNRNSNLKNFKEDRILKLYLLKKYKNNFSQIKNILNHNANSENNYFLKEIKEILDYIDEVFSFDLMLNYSVTQSEKEVLEEVLKVKDKRKSIRLPFELIEELEKEYLLNFKTPNDYFRNIIIVRHIDTISLNEIEEFKCFIISKISKMINVAILKQHQNFKKHKKYDFRILLKDLKEIDEKLTNLLKGY